MEILTLTYLRELLPSAMAPSLHSESLQCSNELFHLTFICSDFDLSSQLICSWFLLSNGSAGVQATFTVILLWAFCLCVLFGKRPQVGSGGSLFTSCSSPAGPLAPTPANQRLPDVEQLTRSLCPRPSSHWAEAFSDHTCYISPLKAKAGITSDLLLLIY